MNQKQIDIIKQQLHVTAGRVTTTSMAVASAFDKEHKHVLRDIEELDCSAEFNRSNFGPVTYKDKKGEERPAFELTKDGFMFLAMGYTGKLAARIKEAYIAAFNQMEQVIRSNMAEARAEGAGAVAFVYAAAAAAGHRSDFLPRLIHLRRAGLSCREAGILLGVEQSTVSAWSRRLRAAGLDLPNLRMSTPAFMQSSHRQLCLPGVAA